MCIMDVIKKTLAHFGYAVCKQLRDKKNPNGDGV